MNFSEFTYEEVRETHFVHVLLRDSLGLKVERVLAIKLLGLFYFSKSVELDFLGIAYIHSDKKWLSNLSFL